MHGGFLVTAHSLFEPFFSPWVPKLALQNSAIIVSPNHRLLPTANGVADVLEDLEDFWQWTRSGLSQVLEHRAPGHTIDLSRLLLVGNSAGGYCVLQLALSHPLDVSALALLYPFVDPKDRIMVTGPAADEPTVLRFPREDIPSKDATIAWIEEARKTITTKAGAERTPFCVSATQNGLFYSTIFDSSNLNRLEFEPLKRIKSGAKLPRKM
jgi:pimeloyl-ACP methyl ester carboxylesterase